MDITEITLENGYKKDEDSDLKQEIMDTQTIIVKEDGTLATAEENGVVAYRVVQVGSSNNENGTLPHIVSTTNAFNNATVQPVQTVLTNPVSGGLYVIGSTNNDIYTRSSNHKPIAPRTGAMIESVRNNNVQAGYRDDRRRVTHNEIERRRRDKINNWIIKISKIIPDCKETSKSGYDGQQSKGGILAKACDYILELRDSNQRLMEAVKKNENLSMELSAKTKQTEILLHENKELRLLLNQHGINLSNLENDSNE